MKYIKGALLFVFILVLTLQINAQRTSFDALLGVQSYFADGTGQKGTGFFISSDGTLLTCYHSVSNAVRITVHFNGRSYPTTVNRLAPNHDLAVLKIRSEEQLPAFSLYEDSPSSLQGRELLIAGHALGMRALQTTARLAQPDWLQSELFRTPDGIRLFNPGTPLLILEARAVHEGMSGAPVLYNESAVGVFCGSVSTGGDIGWAMNPREAFGDDSRLYNESPDRVAWPSFSLMRGNQWRRLLRSSSATDERVEIVSKYVSRWKTEQELYFEHLDALTRLRNEIVDVLTLVTQAIRDRNTPEWFLQELQRRIQTSAGEANLAFDEYQNAYEARFQTTREIFDMAWEMIENVPWTQSNAIALERYTQLGRAQLQASLSEEPNVDESLEEMDERFERRRKLKNLQSGQYSSFKQLEGTLTKMKRVAADEWSDRLELRKGDQLQRKMMANTENLLFLETWEDPWPYVGQGYEIALPAGWSLISQKDTRPEITNLLNQFHEGFAKQGSTLSDCFLSPQIEIVFFCVGSANTKSQVGGYQINLETGNTAYLQEYSTAWTFIHIPKGPGLLKLACVYDNIERQAYVREHCIDFANRISITNDL